MKKTKANKDIKPCLIKMAIMQINFISDTLDNHKSN